MNRLKQGTAAVMLVVSLGLVLPSAFGGPASADISRKSGVQPMVLKCDLDNNDATGDNGYESVFDVTSADHGDELGMMQDLHSSLQFAPVSGKVYSIYTAIEDNTRFAQDDSSPHAKVPLASDDPRLEDGDDDYPVTFDIPPGYNFSVFGDGFDTKKAGKKLKNLVDCVAIDDGLLNPREALNAIGTTQCEKDGDPLNEACYQNIWDDADAWAVDNSKPCVAFGNLQYTKCMALGLTYHYHDEYFITAQMLGSSPKKSAAHQHKHHGKHRHHSR